MLALSLFFFSYFFRAHRQAVAPQSSSETLPGAFIDGAGRRGCCVIRLDGELMGLPHCPAPVLYCTYLLTYLLTGKSLSKTTTLSPDIISHKELEEKKVCYVSELCPALYITSYMLIL